LLISYNNGLYGRRFRARFLARAIYLSLPYNVLVVSGAHPASYPTATGNKTARSEPDHLSHRNYASLHFPVNFHTMHAVANWLGHYATSRKVVGSFRNEVLGFFHLRNPFICTMALGSTHPVTEMSARNLPRCGRVRPTTSPPFMSRLPGKYGILDVSQPNRSTRSGTAAALPFFKLQATF
jgi:hypothetical protein